MPRYVTIVARVDETDPGAAREALNGAIDAAGQHAHVVSFAEHASPESPAEQALDAIRDVVNLPFVSDRAAVSGIARILRLTGRSVR